MGVIILALSSYIDVGRVTSIYVVDAVFSLNSMINDEKYFSYLHSLSCSFTYFPHSLLTSLTSTYIFPVSHDFPSPRTCLPPINALNNWPIKIQVEEVKASFVKENSAKKIKIDDEGRV